MEGTPIITDTLSSRYLGTMITSGKNRIAVNFPQVICKNWAPDQTNKVENNKTNRRAGLTSKPTTRNSSARTCVNNGGWSLDTSLYKGCPSATSMERIKFKPSSESN